MFPLYQIPTGFGINPIYILLFVLLLLFHHRISRHCGGVLCLFPFFAYVIHACHGFRIGKISHNYDLFKTFSRDLKMLVFCSFLMTFTENLRGSCSSVGLKILYSAGSFSFFSERASPAFSFLEFPKSPT